MYTTHSRQQTILNSLSQGRAGVTWRWSPTPTTHSHTAGGGKDKGDRSISDPLIRGVSQPATVHVLTRRFPCAINTPPINMQTPLSKRRVSGSTFQLLSWAWSQERADERGYFCAASLSQYVIGMDCIQSANYTTPERETPCPSVLLIIIPPKPRGMRRKMNTQAWWGKWTVFERVSLSPRRCFWHIQKSRNGLILSEKKSVTVPSKKTFRWFYIEMVQYQEGLIPK